MVRFRDDVGVGCGRRAVGRNEIGISTHQERPRKMNGWTVDVNARSEPKMWPRKHGFPSISRRELCGGSFYTPIASHRGTKKATVLHEQKGSPRRLAVTAVPLNHRSKA